MTYAPLHQSRTQVGAGMDSKQEIQNSTNIQRDSRSFPASSLTPSLLEYPVVLVSLDAMPVS